MIKDLVSFFAPMLLVFGALVFLGVKWLRILDLGAKSKEFPLFFRSLLFYEKQVIRNTFESELRRYFEFSNRVNKWFYSFFLVTLSLYLLMTRL